MSRVLTVRADRLFLAEVLQVNGLPEFTVIDAAVPRFNAREQIDQLRAHRLLHPGRHFRLLVEVDG